MFINRFINWRYFILFILIFSIVSIFFTNQIVLRDFPNSGDEYSYLISAELFSVGKLSVPSPKHREFFDFYHVINDGKFYSKYSPGWPFFLMFGKIIRFPMIINLIFGVLTLIVVYLIGKELFSEKIARLALLLMAISPFFIFNSASYFSHSSTLFFLSLFAYIYFKNLKSDKNVNWFSMGIIMGISFNIRQLEAIVIGACFLVHYIFVAIKSKTSIKPIKKCLLFLAGFLILFGIFLLYNYLQTGNPFLMPFTKYNPRDKFLAFNNEYLNSFSWSLKNNLLKRSLYLNIWIPLCFLFMFIALCSKKEYKYLMLAIFLFLLIAYVFYARSGVNQYGPRYLYSSSFAIFLLMGVGFEKLNNKKIFDFVLLIIIILNLGFFVYASSLFHAQINERMEVYDKVKTQNISNAIVFLNCSRNSMCSGTMPAMDLTRNRIYFNNPVLYVHDLGKRNIVLMEDFPNRDYYSWNCQEIKFNYIKFLDFWEAENVNCKITEIEKE